MSPQPAVEDEVRAVLLEHDRCWNQLDFQCLASLWDTDDPNALYMGDEHPDPVVGEVLLSRHWARLGSRLQGAEMASDPVVIDPLSDRLVLIMMTVRWGFAGVEDGRWNHGRSWVSAVLRRTDAGWRFVSYMERLSELDRPA